MAAKLLREDYLLADEEGWSAWHKAIRSKKSDDYVNRGPGQDGYKLKVMEVPDGNYCGIYEWKIVKPNWDSSTVVYVGSTCRNKEGSLKDRIQEYCNNGSHKSFLFNKHIRHGYDLWYRTKRAPKGKQQAENMENKLLDTYDYLWNERRN